MNLNKEFLILNLHIKSKELSKFKLNLKTSEKLLNIQITKNFLTLFLKSKKIINNSRSFFQLFES